MDDDEESGTQLLPTYNKHLKPPTVNGKPNSKGKGRARAGSLSLADVWDEREEVFGVGDDSDLSGASGGEEEEHEHEGLTAKLPGKKAKSVHWAESSNS